MMGLARFFACTMAVLLIATLSACGQMGPLMLPDDEATTEEQESDEENER